MLHHRLTAPPRETYFFNRCAYTESVSPTCFELFYDQNKDEPRVLAGVKIASHRGLQKNYEMMMFTATDSLRTHDATWSNHTLKQESSSELYCHVYKYEVSDSRECVRVMMTADL